MRCWSQAAVLLVLISVLGKAQTRFVRHALAYVLNNWRKHRTDRAHPSWRVDPYSSAISFYNIGSSDYPTLPVCRAQTWLLRVGWTRHGPIPPSFVPRSA